MNRTPLDSYLPIRLPAAQAQAVKSLADDRQITKSEVVRQALAVYLLAQPQPRHEAKSDAA